MGVRQETNERGERFRIKEGDHTWRRFAAKAINDLSPDSVTVKRGEKGQLRIAHADNNPFGAFVRTAYYLDISLEGIYPGTGEEGRGFNREREAVVKKILAPIFREHRTNANEPGNQRVTWPDPQHNTWESFAATVVNEKYPRSVTLTGERQFGQLGVFAAPDSPYRLFERTARYTASSLEDVIPDADKRVATTQAILRPIFSTHMEKQEAEKTTEIGGVVYRRVTVRPARGADSIRRELRIKPKVGRTRVEYVGNGRIR